MRQSAVVLALVAGGGLAGDGLSPPGDRSASGPTRSLPGSDPGLSSPNGIGLCVSPVIVIAVATQPKPLAECCLDDLHHLCSCSCNTLVCHPTCSLPLVQTYDAKNSENALYMQIRFCNCSFPFFYYLRDTDSERQTGSGWLQRARRYGLLVQSSCSF